MSAKAISEATGKRILNNFLTGECQFYSPSRFLSVNTDTSVDDAVNENPWLKSTSLVVKPDQLIKRRGKLGLIKVNADLPTVKTWIAEKMSQDVTVCSNCVYGTNLFWS